MELYILKQIIIFLTTWLSTIIITKGIDYARRIQLYKDAADRNYKFNYQKLIKETKKEEQFDTYDEEMTLIDKLYSMYPNIPFLNIIQCIHNIKNYIDNKEESIRLLKYKGYLEEMTEREIREYSKKKTGMNAKKITEDTYKKLQNASELYFEDTDSTFYYQVNEELNDIIILKVTGPASYLDEEEQKAIVMEFWQEAIIEIIESFGTVENFKEYAEENKGKEIKISQDEEEKQQKDKTAPSIEPMIQPNKNNKPKTLSKRK